MNPRRRTALVAGALYLLTFVSIPTLSLYRSVRDPNFVAGPGPDTGAIFGGILEIIVALACIGTAVALYPVVKRQNEGVALGFIGTRVLEAGTIFVGVACLLSVVSLRQAGAGASSHHRIHRSAAPRRFRRRRAVRPGRENRPSCRVGRDSDCLMGVFAG